MRTSWTAPLGLALLALAPGLTSGEAPGAALEALVTKAEPGRRGGRLVVALRSEPKTLNPLVATDGASRSVVGQMAADLIHIDRASQRTGPALAREWSVSPDGRRYTLRLRRGLRFSDGHPCDADDVVFSFDAYLDEKTRAPQRDLLIVGGAPIVVRKLDPSSVSFEFKEPYAAAERLFDAFAILPRHLLAKAVREGKADQAWGLASAPSEIAGLGPFRLKAYVPGERIVLERNPYYWKRDRAGTQLPYLDEIVFRIASSEDAQVVAFQAGETDVVSRISAENFEVLEKEQGGRGYRLLDLGPGLEYALLFFNLNDLSDRPLPQLARKQAWFREKAFRQAVSAAIDRDGIVRLVYKRRATPAAGHVTPGNRLWADSTLPAPRRSLERARGLLAGAGFRWNADGALEDRGGAPVELSIVTSASNAQRKQIATILQEDLRALGMKVQAVALENRAVLDRILRTFDYEACVLSLGAGDADPNTDMNVMLSSGATHLWRPGGAQPATPWEAEIDRLMRRQISARKQEERKRLYDRVQQIVADELPLIPLASPSILVGAKTSLGNLRPAILEDYVLWNADELFWRP